MSPKFWILITSLSYSRKAEDQNHFWCHQVQNSWLQPSASECSDQVVWTSSWIPNICPRIHSFRVNSSKCFHLLPTVERRNLTAFYNFINSSEKEFSIQKTLSLNNWFRMVFTILYLLLPKLWVHTCMKNWLNPAKFTSIFHRTRNNLCHFQLAVSPLHSETQLMHSCCLPAPANPI